MLAVVYDCCYSIMFSPPVSSIQREKMRFIKWKAAQQKITKVNQPVCGYETCLVHLNENTTMCSQNPIQWALTLVSPGVKRPGHSAHQTAPFNAENKRIRAVHILSLSVIPSWRAERQSCLHLSPFLENLLMLLCSFLTSNHSTKRPLIRRDLYTVYFTSVSRAYWQTQLT
jgi:hypothetical protein